MRRNTRYEQAMAYYDRAAHFSSIADHRKADDLRRQLHPDLTEEQKAEALRIGRIEFKSAGATRRRGFDYLAAADRLKKIERGE